MKCTVTGCAGFIGSTLVDKLLSKGHQVAGIDNLSTGRMKFLSNSINNSNFNFIEGDMKDIENYKNLINDSEIIFHMAANADVRFGLNHPSKDLNENTLNTFKLLEVMRSLSIKNIIFASTGSIYGESKEIPTTENCPFPSQTSLYGASKLAAEAFISAYCEGFKFNAAVCRFVSLMGPRYTHGHVVDFVKSLKNDPRSLTILGDGSQFKSYFHIKDCMNAMLILAEKIGESIKGFYPINLGTEEGITVKESAEIICKTLGYKPTLNFTGGNQGWIGDNPRIQLDIKKAKSIGWEPYLSIKDSIADTAKWVDLNL